MISVRNNHVDPFFFSFFPLTGIFSTVVYERKPINYVTNNSVNIFLIKLHVLNSSFNINYFVSLKNILGVKWLTPKLHLLITRQKFCVLFCFDRFIPKNIIFNDDILHYFILYMWYTCTCIWRFMKVLFTNSLRRPTPYYVII